MFPALDHSLNSPPSSSGEHHFSVNKITCTGRERKSRWTLGMPCWSNLQVPWELPCPWLFLNFGGNLLPACISGLITSVILCGLFTCSLLSLISSLCWYHKTGNPFFSFSRDSEPHSEPHWTREGLGESCRCCFTPRGAEKVVLKQPDLNRTTAQTRFYCIFNVSSLWLRLME